jgi:hypothetical protein
MLFEGVMDNFGHFQLAGAMLVTADHATFEQATRTEYFMHGGAGLCGCFIYRLVGPLCGGADCLASSSGRRPRGARIAGLGVFSCLIRFRNLRGSGHVAGQFRTFVRHRSDIARHEFQGLLQKLWDL